MKYDEKDVPLFRKVICPHCNSYETSCKKKEKENNTHWFLMCPKFFNWAIGLTNDEHGWLIKKVKPKREEF
jgi:hypothetical protein